MRLEQWSKKLSQTSQHYSERSKKMADKPVTREEKYLAYLTGDYAGELPKPITRKEKYLYELCLKGIGGEISPEEIKNAVNEYLEKNPVKPGATTEQAQQIEQNKTNIASLKEDKIDKPTEIPTAGEYIRVKSVNDGIPEFEWADKEETILDAIIKEETSVFSLEFNVPYKEVSVRIKTSKISSEMQPISIYPIINNNNGIFGYIHTRYKGTKEYYIYLAVKKIAQTIMTWISINTTGIPLNMTTIPTGASEAINKITMNIGLPVGSEMIVKGVKL